MNGQLYNISTQTRRGLHKSWFRTCNYRFSIITFQLNNINILHSWRYGVVVNQCTHTLQGSDVHEDPWITTMFINHLFMCVINEWITNGSIKLSWGPMRFWTSELFTWKKFTRFDIPGLFIRYSWISYQVSKCKVVHKTSEPKDNLFFFFGCNLNFWCWCYKF